MVYLRLMKILYFVWIQCCCVEMTKKHSYAHLINTFVQMIKNTLEVWYFNVRVKYNYMLNIIHN